MIRFHRIAAAALVAASALSAQAAEFYVGGSVGQSRYETDDNQVSDSGVTARITDKTGNGFKFFFGAEVMKQLAFEAGYVDLGKLKFGGNVLGTPFTGNIRGTGVFADVVGQVPLGQDFALFGKLGIFSGKAKVSVSAAGANGSDSDSGTDVKFGLGASYAINKNLALRAEWERFRFNVYDDKSDADLVSVGLSYKF